MAADAGECWFSCFGREEEAKQPDVCICPRPMIRAGKIGPQRLGKIEAQNAGILDQQSVGNIEPEKGWQEVGN